MIRMLSVAVLAIAVTTIFAQPMIPREYEAPAPVQVDSSQQIADRVISSKIPVMLDFWAPWCGPCRMLDPVMDTLRRVYKGRVQFIKANVDIQRQLAGYFRVQGIPAVFVISDSSVQQYIVGFHQKSDYVTVLDSVLKKFSAKRAMQGKTGAVDTAAKTVQKPAATDSVKKKEPVKK